MFPGPPSLGGEDIPDPLYSGGGDEAARLREAIAAIRGACAGLLQHLLDLSDRCCLRMWACIRSHGMEARILL